MNTTLNGHKDPGRQAGEPESLGELLAAALNMEDQLSRGVYEDYLNRENWPTGLGEEAFLGIRKRLTVLIEDTKKHRMILQTLADEYGQSRKSR